MKNSTIIIIGTIMILATIGSALAFNYNTILDVMFYNTPGHLQMGTFTNIQQATIAYEILQQSISQAQNTIPNTEITSVIYELNGNYKTYTFNYYTVYPLQNGTTFTEMYDSDIRIEKTANTSEVTAAIQTAANLYITAHLEDTPIIKYENREDPLWGATIVATTIPSTTTTLREIINISIGG